MQQGRQSERRANDNQQEQQGFYDSDVFYVREIDVAEDDRKEIKMKIVDELGSSDESEESISVKDIQSSRQNVK